MTAMPFRAGPGDHGQRGTGGLQVVFDRFDT